MFSSFLKVSELCSKITTQEYSTSFSSAIKMLSKNIQQDVYNIYGFVRFADEIVDTFQGFKKEELLQDFEQQTWRAIESKISLNPILNSFQKTVNHYNIDIELIKAFFFSMEMDLTPQTFDKEKYEKYIYGSAESVGLMCLYVFCNGDEKSFQYLKPGAQALGSAFQKVNFLRDIKADNLVLNRTYFPNVDFKKFCKADKLKIEQDISNDFNKAFVAIKQLPLNSRFGVYVAYNYYLSLFNKIKETNENNILESRIRIPNYQKAYILSNSFVKNKFNLI